MARLPTELLYYIIECLVPANPPLALPAAHSVTRTLVNLCLVSKTIHYAATRHLFAHCLYIDSPDRLVQLQQTLIDHHQGQAFGSRISPQSPLDNENAESTLDARLRRSPISVIESLFLAPFPTDTIDSPEIAPRVLGLCTILGPHLSRLVVDIPFRSLYPEDDTNHVRPFLHAAFSKLVALEEFVSTRDELFLDVTERDWEQPEVAVWSRWPKLKRLALYNADVSSDGFIQDIQRCENLTHLVLTRADGLPEAISSLYSMSGRHLTLQRSRHLQRLALVNTTRSHQYSPTFSEEWWEHCFVGKVWNGAPGGHRVQIVKISVPVPAHREDNDIEACQEWVREAAMEGTLWEWNGKHLLVRPDPKDLPRFKFGWVPPGWSSADFPPDR